MALVVNLESIALDCFPEFSFGLSPRLNNEFHGGIEKFQAVSSVVLGLVHRDIGLFQKLLEFGLAFPKNRDPHAGATVMDV